MQKKPNIVYFFVDDLGYGDVSCLNPESKITPPHIDRVARDGMIFTDAHSTSAACLPSRYSLLRSCRQHLSELRQQQWLFTPRRHPKTQPGELRVGDGATGTFSQRSIARL